MLLITYFEKFVSNIQPSVERIRAVAEAHNELRDHLSGDAELDHAVDDSFLSGSYGRSTATAPIKDVDIILLLEDTEISEDRTKPSPRAVLEDLKDTIDDFYDDVNLETQRRSIQVQLPEDDIRMDVVPAIAPSGKDAAIFVPDYEQQKWIVSHPKGHIQAALDANKVTDGRFVRLVKAFKWWRKQKFTDELAPKSFLLESIVLQHVDTHTTNLAACFEATVRNIVSSYQTNFNNGTVPHVPDPSVPDNDLAVSCSWTSAMFNAFYQEAERALKVAQVANHPDTEKDDTTKLWQSLFGNEYPRSLTEEEEKTIRESITTTQVSPARARYPFSVCLSARLAMTKNGKTFEDYPASGGRRLAKGLWIRFRFDGTDVPPPYQIRWHVKNHGREARDAQQLVHSRLSNNQWEWYHTAYKGHHFMDLEIIKHGKVVAMSRYTVHIR